MHWFVEEMEEREVGFKGHGDSLAVKGKKWTGIIRMIPRFQAWVTKCY